MERGELRQMLWSYSTEERGKAPWKSALPIEVAGFMSIGSKEKGQPEAQVPPIRGQGACVPFLLPHNNHWVWCGMVWWCMPLVPALGREAQSGRSL